MGADVRASHLHPVLVYPGGSVLGSGGMGPGVCRVGVVVPEGAHRQRVDSSVELCGWASGDAAFGACGICFRIICGEIYGAEAGAGAGRRGGGGEEGDLEREREDIDYTLGSGRSATSVLIGIGRKTWEGVIVLLHTRGDHRSLTA